MMAASTLASQRSTLMARCVCSSSGCFWRFVLRGIGSSYLIVPFARSFLILIWCPVIASSGPLDGCSPISTVCGPIFACVVHCPSDNVRKRLKVRKRDRERAERTQTLQWIGRAWRLIVAPVSFRLRPSSQSRMS
ncbi:hypothetical protein MPLA_320020 [Mesorhizobium sp. ORS 3359]|nr:hypothetical protein MPLA_320020 [Mesorhizobium sp. ORS 3359]